MSTRSLSFGTQEPSDPRFCAPKGGTPGQIDDVRADVEAGFKNNEGRVGFPELFWLDGTPPVAAGGAVVLKGSALLQGQTFDTVTITDSEAASLGSVVITALKPGVSGISVVVATPSSTLAVTWDATNKVLTIRPAAAGSTDDAVATAINADASAVRGILRAASASAGSFKHAIASTPLAGGAGLYAGNVVSICGTECLPANTTGTAGAAAWTDTGITVTMPDMHTTPGIAAGDVVNARIKTNGVVTGNLSFVVTAAG